MRYCGRCGKEIEDSDGMYCDECFSVIIATKISGEKINYKKVPEKREKQDKLPGPREEKTLEKVKSEKHIKERKSNYVRLFLGIVFALTGVLNLLLAFYYPHLATTFIVMGISSLLIGIIEILKEKVLPRNEKFASITEVCIIGAVVIYVLSFVLLNLM